MIVPYCGGVNHAQTPSHGGTISTSSSSSNNHKFPNAISEKWERGKAEMIN